MKKIIFFFLVLIAAGLSVIHAQGTWTQKADLGGADRYLAVAFSIFDKGYLGTGVYQDETGLHYLKDFWQYDPALNSWTQIADFGGSARIGASAFAVLNKGYVGTGYDGSHNVRDFWEYDPITNTWEQKSDFGGTARESAVGFSVSNKGFLGTGFDDSDNRKDLWEYDPASDSWTQKADFGGAARYDAVGFSIGSNGYVGVGVEFEDWHINYFKDFWEYDPDLDMWTRRADFGGMKKASVVGFSIAGKGYIPNGYGMNEFWEYNPSTNTWSEKANFPFELGNGVGLSIGEKGYVQAYNSGFWEYTPEATTSCAIPSGLSTLNITGTSAKLNWDAVSGATGYAIRYRAVGTNELIRKSATTNSRKLSGLTPNTSYVWQVKTMCDVVPPGLHSDWSSQQLFTTGAFKLADEQPATFNVYPNPTSGQFKIAITLGNEETYSAIIQVLNSLGQIMYNEKTAVASGMLLQEINLKDLPAGMYLVKVIVNDQVYSAPINFQK